MANATETALKIRPGLSLRLGLFVVLSHVLTITVVVALPLPMPLVLGLGLGVVISLVYNFRARVLRQGAFALEAVELDSHNEWTLYTARGAIERARLHPSSFVRPWLLVLNFSVGRFRSRSLILFPDAMQGETLRRLRVRLRTRPGCRQPL